MSGIIEQNWLKITKDALSSWVALSVQQVQQQMSPLGLPRYLMSKLTHPATRFPIPPPVTSYNSGICVSLPQYLGTTKPLGYPIPSPLTESSAAANG
jgi:hypothetical protein